MSQHSGHWRFGTVMTLILQGLIVMILIASFVSGGLIAVFIPAVVLFMTLIPTIIERKYKVAIPWWITFLIVLSLYIHLAGEHFGWYVTFYPYYDKIAHLIAGITAALIGFTAVLLMDRYTENNFDRYAIILMIIMFTMAFGAFWEIFEFTMDTFFGTTLQHGNTDTMLDLVFDLFAGIIVAAIGNFYLRRLSKCELMHMLAGNPEFPKKFLEKSCDGDPEPPSRNNSTKK
jgi:hypothetical protein